MLGRFTLFVGLMKGWVLCCGSAKGGGYSLSFHSLSQIFYQLNGAEYTTHYKINKYAIHAYTHGPVTGSGFLLSTQWCS